MYTYETLTPFQLKHEFTAVEEQHFDTLFHSWRHEGGKVGFGEHFISLFMAIEEDLIKSMQRDRIDRHASTERGWTPPPKQSTDKF